MGYHPFDKYPDTFGRKPNISVPSMNTENMNQINNPVIDKKMIDMICNLVCSSSSSSSSSDTYEFTGFQQHSKETLNRQYSRFHEFFIYNSYSDLHLKSKPKKIMSSSIGKKITQIC